ncbi:hypothetical protein VPZ60_004260 [Salmonella enterica]|nr:hypothetical protein [Salmonella enterica]
MKRAIVLHIFEYIAPAGMREVREYGLDVWQFTNFDGEPLGQPIPLLRKPSRQNLASVHHGYYNGEEIRFCTPESFGSKEYWRKVHAVMKWRVDPNRIHLLNPNNENSADPQLRSDS